MEPREFIAGFIDAHEGGLSMHRADNGNWYSAHRYKLGQPQRREQGRLVGSKYGVTAYAINRYKGKVLGELEMAAAIATLKREEAIDIGFRLYYLEPGFDKLEWNRVTAAIMDKAWGSGPGTAVMMLQRMVAVKQDGKLGNVTAGAYNMALEHYGEEEMAARWADIRMEKDNAIASNEGPNDPDKAFIKGWHNRTRSFLPGTKWWNSWEK